MSARRVVTSIAVAVQIACQAAPSAAPPQAGSAPAAEPVAAPVASALRFEVAPQQSPDSDIEFKAALDLKQKPVGLEPQLRHGRIAVSANWPASLYVTFDTPLGRAACTAALIGPEVMLTAAHCVPTTGKVGFRYEGQAQAYAAQCTQHPKYVSKQDASADFALCRIQPAFKAPPNFTFETVDLASIGSMRGKQIVLTGFGCVSDIVKDNVPDGRYRIGSNEIDETSLTPPQRLRDDVYYATKENNNLFTVDDPTLANLCPGDSGGPAFHSTGAGTTFAERRIVGVNSRVFYRDSAKTSYGSSLISSTGGQDFRVWATDWTKTGHVDACGLAGALANCRN